MNEQRPTLSYDAWQLLLSAVDVVNWETNNISIPQDGLEEPTMRELVEAKLTYFSFEKDGKGVYALTPVGWKLAIDVAKENADALTKKFEESLELEELRTLRDSFNTSLTDVVNERNALRATVERLELSWSMFRQELGLSVHDNVLEFAKDLKESQAVLIRELADKQTQFERLAKPAHAPIQQMSKPFNGLQDCDAWVTEMSEAGWRVADRLVMGAHIIIFLEAPVGAVNFVEDDEPMVIILSEPEANEKTPVLTNEGVTQAEHTQNDAMTILAKGNAIVEQTSISEEINLGGSLLEAIQKHGGTAVINALSPRLQSVGKEAFDNSMKNSEPTATAELITELDDDND